MVEYRTIDMYVGMEGTIERDIEEYLTLKREIDEMQKRLKELRKHIIEYYGEGKHKIGDHEVVIREVTRVQLKTGAVKKKLIELGILDEYVYSVEYTKLEIR